MGGFPPGPPMGGFPPGPPMGGFPPGPPPAPKPFYGRPWFIVLAVLVGLGVLSDAVDDGGDDTRAPVADSVAPPVAAGEAAPSAPTVAAAPSPRIGEPAADGQFQFVVGNVECGATTIGGAYLNTQAQGQFCIVDLTVTNIGDEPQSFLGDNTTLVNAQGQEYSASTAASFYLDDASSFYEEINPGNTLNSKVVFDVPPGMVPTAIELHDSAFSGGVTVTLV